MSENVSHKSKVQSAVVTAIVAVLTLLLLLITFRFQKEEPIAPPIEIAMNFGNTPTGSGEAEPKPQENAAQQAAAAPSASSTPDTSTPLKAVTQDTPTPRPTATKETKKETTKKAAQPKQNTAPKEEKKGDERGKNALDQLLGGKGNSNSSGQGNNNTSGNVGDPKGKDSFGDSIGENWKTTIPPGQKHNCEASGIVQMNITVRANGSIKKVTPKGVYNDCLVKRATDLIKQYVTAAPGKDGRMGTYKVDLR